MRPSLARLDLGDYGLMNTVFFGYDRLKADVHLDRRRLLLGQLCKMALRSPGLSSVRDFVLLVLNWGFPSQVFNAWIGSVAVFMGALLTGFRKSPERLDYQKVNENCFPFTALTKSNLKVSLGGFGNMRDDDLRFDASRSISTGEAHPRLSSHPALITDGVPTFVAKNRKPSLLLHKESFEMNTNYAINTKEVGLCRLVG